MEIARFLIEILGALCFFGKMLQVNDIPHLDLEAAGLFLWALAILLAGMPSQ
jgi:hypothetical protein